jgi:quercetin dioxygenase-like cupin family protein
MENTKKILELQELVKSIPDHNIYTETICGYKKLEMRAGTGLYFQLLNSKNSECGQTFFSKDSILDTHLHNITEILICISGVIEIDFYDNNETVVLQQTGVCKIAPGRPHTARAIEDTYIYVIKIPPENK